MTYETAIEVLESEYSGKGHWYPYYALINTPEGTIEVLVVQNNNYKWDVWNIHPLRKGWQLVYTLEHCDPSKQLQESLASLKRLFEN